jgi:hypothetical protein
MAPKTRVRKTELRLKARHFHLPDPLVLIQLHRTALGVGRKWPKPVDPIARLRPKRYDITEG